MKQLNWGVIGAGGIARKRTIPGIVMANNAKLTAIMDVNEAVKLTKIISPKLGIPTHYGMFESNNEDPEKYTRQLENGFEMKYNIEYDIEEVLRDV